MKIAVLGAGLAGLATSWYLLHESQASVALDLYDAQPIGEGTSGIASGLLHSFTASRASVSWHAEHCLKKTHQLITESANYSDAPPILTKGLLQIALNTKQAQDFQQRAKEIPRCYWLEKKEIENAMPYMAPPFGGLLIQSALTLDMPCYLKGLCQAILRLGGTFIQKKITDPEIFEQYDKIVIAMGTETLAFSILKELPVSLVKGQLLELQWPATLDPPLVTILAQMHLVMQRDYRSFILGASFEREYIDEKKDEEIAKKILLSKFHALFPALTDVPIMRCASGMRVCPKKHLPMIGQIDKKFWFFTGLCSKGILFHAYLGDALARALLKEDPSFIPKEIYTSLGR